MNRRIGCANLVLRRSGDFWILVSRDTVTNVYTELSSESELINAQRRAHYTVYVDFWITDPMAVVTVSSFLTLACCPQVDIVPFGLQASSA